MKKTNLKMRILSMFLCLLMVVTSISADAFAAEYISEVEINEIKEEEENSKTEIVEDTKNEGMESEDFEIEEILEENENNYAFSDSTDDEKRNETEFDIEIEGIPELISEENLTALKEETQTFGIMVNNSYMADKQNPVKAVLGEDGIYCIENYTTNVNYLWLSLPENTTVKEYTLYQGSTSSSYSKYLSPRTNNNVYDGTTYQYYINTSYKLPLVAKFDLEKDGSTSSHYVIVDSKSVGKYVIAADGFIAKPSNLYEEDGVTFTEAGQTVTLTPITTSIGSGDEQNISWAWSTSDKTVALVDSNGKVTSVGGGTATITATYDQISVSCTVNSTAQKHTTHTYVSNKCSVCGTRKPSNVSVKFTLVDKNGEFVTAKDNSTELYQTALTVSDVDCDGTITYYDVSYAAHQTYYTDGINGFDATRTDDAINISKFWGISTGEIAYYCNHSFVNSLTDKVSNNANVVAFFYRDKDNHSDIYTYFTNASGKAVTGTTKELTVKYASETVPVGATVAVYDSNGNVAVTTTVSNDGNFQLNLTEVGTYSILVHGITKTGVPVLPSCMTIEAFAPVSATVYMTVVNDDGKFAKSKSGEEIYRFPIKVFDNPDNPDGKVTIYEALVQLHEQECPAGVNGFKDENGFIKWLWGYNTGGWLGYYFNDVYLQGYGAIKTGTNGREFTDRLLGTEIVDGVDYYTIYAYQTYTDTYTYFNPVEETAVVGIEKTFTVYGNSTYGNSAFPEGAVIKVSDDTGKELTELGTAVGADGTFSITFPTVGKYTIDLKNSEKKAFVPSRCMVTVTKSVDDDSDKDDSNKDDSNKDDNKNDSIIDKDDSKEEIPEETPVETPDNKEEVVVHDYKISYTSSAIYTGSAITPSVTVKDGNRLLAEGTDYTVTYKNNINVGKAQVTVKGKGGHDFNETKNFTITACSLSDASISVSSIYSEKTVKNPVPVITRNGKKLSNGKDFILNYENGGIYSKSGKITVKGEGNYTGSISVAVTVVDAKTTNLISKAKVSNVKNFTYGENYKQNPTVKFGKAVLSEGKDYEISYENTDKAGTATMILTGKGDYVGEKRVNFKLTGTSIKKATVTGLNKVVNYTGSEIKADYTLSLNGKTLTEGKDYTVAYGKNISAGKASITFTGMGAYTDSVKKTFTIGKCSLENATVTMATTAAYAKGGAKPSMTITVNGMTLREKSDYTVSYKNNKKVGATATVTITGKGSFSGKIVKTFTVGKQSLSSVNISVADMYVKNGKVTKFQKVVLTDVDGKKLSAGKDYEKKIVYKDANGNVLSNAKSLKVGDTVTVVVTGTGAYEGSVSTTYKILSK